MSEFSRFFDHVDGDRVYNADAFAEYFRMVLTDGILNGGYNLSVYATGGERAVHIDPGKAWIQGYFYKLDGDLKLDVIEAHGTYDRIDRVVLRLDRRTQSRNIRAFMKPGEAAMTPQPPALQRDDDVWELSLARVLVVHNTSVVSVDNITDERLDASVCGLVNSLIQVDTAQMQEQFDAFMETLNNQGYAPADHTHVMKDVTDLGSMVNQDVRSGSNPTFGTVTASKVIGAVYA